MQGEFEQNRIQGRGRLEWDDDCWYEGDFLDGLRHGEGVLVDRKHNRIHAGQWRMGKYKKKLGSECRLSLQRVETLVSPEKQSANV